MKNKLAITLVLICSFFISNSQQYQVSSIPDSLLKHANVIKRFEEVEIEIVDVDKAVIKHKYVYTILNEAGASFATYNNSFDKLRKLRKIDGKLYDANGMQLKDMKRKDIYEGSDNDDSFLTDDRFKAFSFFHNTYPYTVEYEDEVVLNGIYYLYPWIAVDYYNMAVQYTKLTIKQPKEYNVRLKITGNDFITKFIKDNNQVFELKNFKAKQSEPFAPYPEHLLPNIRIAPNNFSISGYNGNMNNWKNFGKFHTELNKGKDDLPDDIKKSLYKLVENKTTTEEKVNAVYNYLQENTRYISIQLGIGGWQPLPASFVAQKKYGDCKALSNYMVTMLKEVGIKANYVIIKSDKYERAGLVDSFPSVAFNHIVCCVPNAKDTIWLECTSQTNSAGYMGTSTGNKKAVLIDDDGGYVVQTPRFNLNNDYTQRTIKGTVDVAGKIIIQSNTVYSGTEQEETNGLYNYANEEQKKRYYNQAYVLPNFNVTNFQLKQQKGRVPKMHETVDIEAENYAATSGKRLFIVPNLFAREPKLSNDKPREFPIVYTRTYRDIDSITITLPNGFTVESMPKSVDVINEFGKYKIQYAYNNNTIQVIRLYEQQVNTFPSAKYQALVDFYDVMFKADRAKMVLVKKEE